MNESLEGQLFNLIGELKLTHHSGRDWDAKIGRLLGELGTPNSVGEKLLFAGWSINDMGPSESSIAHTLSVPPYTTSFDAAISLIDGDILDILQRAQAQMAGIPQGEGYKDQLVRYIVIEALSAIAFKRLCVTQRSAA